MANVDIKKYLKSKTMEEIESLTMDVSRSFLNGCPCSPLAITPDSGILSKAINAALAHSSSYTQSAIAGLETVTAYGYKMYENTMSDVNSMLSNISNTGMIYISKTGKKINVTTDFIPHAISIGTAIGTSVMECVTDETKEIVNSAISKILKFPEPEYFTSYLATYFGKWLNSEECKELTKDALSINLPVDDKNIPDYDKEFSENGKKRRANMMEKITELCYTRVPEITGWVEDTKKNIMNFTSMACSYVAFGSDWVSNAVNKYLDDKIEDIEDHVNLKLNKILKQKQSIINMIAEDLTDEAIHLHKKLLADVKKLMNRQTATKVRKAQLKAKAAIVSAAAKVCARFGVPVPKFDDVIKVIEAARLGEYSDKLSQLVKIASAVNSGENNNNPKVTDGTPEQSEQLVDGARKEVPSSDSQYYEPEGDAEPPTNVPTDEGEVGYGPDKSRWVSYKHTVTKEDGTIEYSYRWTLVATAQVERERYSLLNLQEAQERQFNDPDNPELATAYQILQQNQAQAAAAAAAASANDPIEYLINTGMDRDDAQKKWQANLKLGRTYVANQIRGATSSNRSERNAYPPIWKRIAKSKSLQERIIDAQARIYAKIPVNDTEALDILNGRKTR